MPRGEARLRVTIWDDADYTSLTMDAQWLYEALLSQKALNHAGVLVIPRREWSNLCVDDDAADRIVLARKLLEDRRYIVVDDATDELLIRSYIRRDVESAPPGTFRSAMNSAIAVASPRLRAALHAELRRLDMALIESKRRANGELPIDALRRALDALRPQGDDEPSPPPAESLVDEPDDLRDEPPEDVDEESPHGMDMACDHDAHGTDSHGMCMACGVDVGRWRRRQRRDLSPDVATYVPYRETRTRRDARRTALENAHSAAVHRLVDAFADRCAQRPPRSVLGQLHGPVQELVNSGWPEDAVTLALDTWGAKGLGVRLFPQIAHEVVNRRVVAPVATTTQRVQGALSLLRPEDDDYDDPQPQLSTGSEP